MAIYLNQTVGNLDADKQSKLYQDYLATTLLAQTLALYVSEKCPTNAATNLRALINQMAEPQRNNPDFAEAEKLALEMLKRCPF